MCEDSESMLVYLITILHLRSVLTSDKGYLPRLYRAMVMLDSLKEYDEV
jgi:ABC-type siderophore export system fused ATPase/permease subunit